ncbi:hypothetical protein [Luteibacter sp. ME-Dv--P-043b]|uniref:hypothetical protein n=1 Tax=Luteibacter sp. ME-Dv--P-043b TaxID=3040291 RepID=UPI0025534F67|nr:hypothetical protein [Luteibacter sp. ME-Dv--P-043b]
MAYPWDEIIGSVAGPYYAIKAKRLEGQKIVFDGLFVYLLNGFVKKCDFEEEAINYAVEQNNKFRSAGLAWPRPTKARVNRVLVSEAWGQVVEVVDYLIDENGNETPFAPSFETWTKAGAVKHTTLAEAHADLKVKRPRRLTPR